LIGVYKCLPPLTLVGLINHELAAVIKQHDINPDFPPSRISQIINNIIDIPSPPGVKSGGEIHQEQEG
jgi:hypothetical protein